MTNRAAEKFAILQEAIEWSATERAARLEARCAGTDIDPSEILNLIALETDAEGFLADSPRGLGNNLPEIEGYRVIRLLGSGGMGRVYLAKENHPAREVAIKLIDARGNTTESALRFQAEQGAMARLNHAGIAQLYAAGQSESGDLYFAMELVDGQSVVEYCDHRKLSLSQRIAIVIDVCDAVQHAHQKQILHRDLKPSNILVFDDEGKPTVKVIDFGIAKALDGQLTDNTLMTGDNLIGTPAYMSPESLRGEADTRSDVYALGMVLYELLVGVRPFEKDQPSRGELLYRVHNQTRPLPSRLYLELDQPAQLAAERSTRPGQLTESLRGDLDAIVAKATAKDLADRYAAVAELKNDLSRYLRSEPVSARDTSLADLTRKFFRRNRALAWSITGAAFAVTLAALIATLGWLEAREQTRVAQSAAREATELSEFLTQIFELADPNENIQGEVTARQLIDQAAQELSTRFSDEPLLRAKFARTIAGIYSKLALYGEAEPLLLESQSIQQNHNATATREYAETIYDLGSLAFRRGQYERAVDWYDEAIDLTAALDGSDSSEVAHGLNGMASALIRLGQYEQAKASLLRAAEIWRSENDREALARALAGLATIEIAVGDKETGLTIYEQALDLRVAALGPRHPHVAASHENVCYALTELERLDAAVPHCERAIELYLASFGDDYPELSRTQPRLARIYRELGNWDDVHRLRSAISARSLRRYGPSAPETLRAQHTEAYQLWLAGEYAAAEGLFAQVLDGKQKVYGDSYTTALTAMGLGGVYWKLGRFGEAERLLLAAVPQIETAKGDHTNTSLAYEYLIGMYKDRNTEGDLGNAQSWLTRLLTMIERVPTVVDEERLERILRWQRELKEMA